MKTTVFNTLLLILLFTTATATASPGQSFLFNGFHGASLLVNGAAEITRAGLLRLTQDLKEVQGHAFHPTQIHVDKISSFSTTFVFAVASKYANLSGHGITFLLSRTTRIVGSLPSQYLGLKRRNNVVAVELDTVQDLDLKDINDNHVGVDIKSLISVKSTSAGYFTNQGRFKNLSLISGDPMQLWVDYDGIKKRLDVTLAPGESVKPEIPLLSVRVDMSKEFGSKSVVYVGFSSSTGSIPTSHYILGWSFSVDGVAQGIDFSRLPSLLRPKSRMLLIWLPVILSSVAITVAVVVAVMVYRRRKFAELLEDWELEYGPNRFSYRDLYVATKGFRERELVGVGGFGRVYKGVLRDGRGEVAIKRVSHESRQGMREFVAEIASVKRLRHQNIVQLLGYCRRKGELILVYDYMSNGSLDNFLFDPNKPLLSWSQRFQVIKGVASGLLYLHEGWEQLIVHRDIKSSNVLLDGEMNGRLSDFGLARLYDHGTGPHTTQVVGTLGYLAPELTKTGKATTATDVYAFGAFLLEVACARRPIDPRASPTDLSLSDWVLDHWRRGLVVEAVDARLEGDYATEEVELVLKLGLLCVHAVAEARPSMRQVVQFLDRDVEITELSPDYIYVGMSGLDHCMGFNEYFMSYAMTSSNQGFLHSSVAESRLSVGC
ncbi:L-type lectin-domain containing receptor kinase IV.1 [Acorus gramineus]|uniref:non-specific serine/threonine protein kinase n=1 Tax=Acorus gramineus TaxID=55184 RepID=A0AAV9AIB9_ACOGR|nr:L-type lectin-domain containing receptor kinase IV.1 [Acorus gramineus]